MSKYLFVERDSQTGRPKTVATAAVNGGSPEWSGDEAEEIRHWLTQEKFSGLRGKKFDEGTPAHWKQLPELVSGSYFWVVKEGTT